MKYPNRIQIPGVTGFGRWHFWERHTGRKGWGQGQICRTEQGEYLSPWLIKRHHYFTSYCSGIYLRGVQELEPVIREVAAMVEELKAMALPPPASSCQCAEEAQRLAQSQADRAAAQTERRKAIRVRLAEIRSQVDSQAQALEHLLSRAREKLEAHTCAYWEGVLSAADGSLPAAPPPCQCQLVEEQRYETYLAQIRAMLSQGLGEEVKRA